MGENDESFDSFSSDDSSSSEDVDMKAQRTHDMNASFAFYKNMITGVEHTRDLRSSYAHWHLGRFNAIPFAPFVLGMALYIAKIFERLNELNKFIRKSIDMLPTMPTPEILETALTFRQQPLAHKTMGVDPTELDVALDEIVTAVKNQDVVFYGKMLEVMKSYLTERFIGSHLPFAKARREFADQLVGGTWSNAFYQATNNQKALNDFLKEIDGIVRGDDGASFFALAEECLDYVQFVLAPASSQSPFVEYNDNYRNSVETAPKTAPQKNNKKLRTWRDDYDYAEKFDDGLVEEYDIDLDFATVANMGNLLTLKVTMSMPSQCLVLLGRVITRDQMIQSFRRAFTLRAEIMDVNINLAQMTMTTYITEVCQVYDALKRVNVLDLPLFNVDSDTIGRIIDGLVDMEMQGVYGEIIGGEDVDVSESEAEVDFIDDEDNAIASISSGEDSDDNDNADEDDSLDEFIDQDDESGLEEARNDLREQQAGRNRVSALGQREVHRVELDERDKPWTNPQPPPQCQAEPGYHLYRIFYIEYRQGLFAFKLKRGMPAEEFEVLMDEFLDNGYPILAFDHGDRAQFEADLRKGDEEKAVYDNDSDSLIPIASFFEHNPGLSMVDQYWHLLPEKTKNWFRGCARYLAKRNPDMFADHSWWFNGSARKRDPLPWYDGWKLFNMLDKALEDIFLLDTSEEKDYAIFLSNGIQFMRTVKARIDECPHRQWIAAQAKAYCAADETRFDDMIDAIVSHAVTVADPDQRVKFYDYFKFMVQCTDSPSNLASAIAHQKGKRHFHKEAFQGVPNALIALAHTMTVFVEKYFVPVRFLEEEEKPKKRDREDDMDKADHDDMPAQKEARFKHFLFRKFE
jgi:hypothetical protein